MYDDVIFCSWNQPTKICVQSHAANNTATTFEEKWVPKDYRELGDL